MTRPIFWALGVTAAASVWGIGLASRFERADTATVAAIAPASAPAGNAPINSLTLYADARGHFETEVSVDGRGLRMLVDTGASHCAFTYEDAERIGIRVYASDFQRKVETANGTVSVAAVRVPSIRVGTISIRDVEAVVLPRGRLATSLLGMSFLRRLSAFNMAGGRLTLRG